MSKLNGMWIWLCKDGEKISIIFLIGLKTITLFDKISSLYKEWLWSTSQWAEVSECVIHLNSTCWLTAKELLLYFILILSTISQFHSLSISGKMYLCHSFIPSPSAYPSMHVFTQFTFKNCFTPRRESWYTLIYLVKTWTNKRKSSPNTQGCIKNREQGDHEEVPITPGSWDRSVWRDTWLASIQPEVPLGEGPYTQHAACSRRGESAFQAWMPFHPTCHIEVDDEIDVSKRLK